VHWWLSDPTSGGRGGGLFCLVIVESSSSLVQALVRSVGRQIWQPPRWRSSECLTTVAVAFSTCDGIDWFSDRGCKTPFSAVALKSSMVAGSDRHYGLATEITLVVGWTHGVSGLLGASTATSSILTCFIFDDRRGTWFRRPGGGGSAVAIATLC
jgi:hypothetical protein